MEGASTVVKSPLFSSFLSEITMTEDVALHSTLSLPPQKAVNCWPQKEEAEKSLLYRRENSFLQDT
jgi:hypothetical protein